MKRNLQELLNDENDGSDKNWKREEEEIAGWWKEPEERKMREVTESGRDLESGLTRLPYSCLSLERNWTYERVLSYWLTCEKM